MGERAAELVMAFCLGGIFAVYCIFPLLAHLQRKKWEEHYEAMIALREAERRILEGRKDG